MEREKTAVEWLEGQLIKEGIYVGEELYNQAKQMEKEQIIEAVYYGPDYNKAEDYYQSKYGKDENKAENND